MIYTAGLPRSIIKKYGVSKKAWAVFRGNKTSGESRKKRRGGRMARRGRSGRRGRSRGGFGMGGLLSTKNILGTLGGAYIAPMVGLDSKIGAAAGSYLIGKQGIIGAGVGYVAAPIVLGMIGGVAGNTPKQGAGTIFY